jgi:hypothetical protein
MKSFTLLLVLILALALCIPTQTLGAMVEIELSDTAVITPADMSSTARALLEVDLPAALSNVTIDYAVLYLNLGLESESDDPVDIEAFMLSHSWEPETVSWGSWADPGGDYLDRSRICETVGVSSDTTVGLDVTMILQRWIDKKKKNFGLITLVDDDFDGSLSFLGIEGVPGDVPKVKIYYSRRK